MHCLAWCGPCLPKSAPAEVNADLGVTVAEFEAIIGGLGFSLEAGFTDNKLKGLVLKDVAWCRFKEPHNGYHLASGIKIFMGRKNLSMTADIQLPDGTQVCLKSGAHFEQSLLQACGIKGLADVFLSHWQGEAVSDTLEGAKDFVKRKGSAAIRFWLDFTSLNQNEITWTSKKELTKATIVRPKTLAVVMSPWHGGMTLTRIWCCLEMGLHVTAGHDVFIVLPDDEKKKFMEALRTDDESIMTNLCKVDVEKGQASKEEDKKWVLEEIRDADGTFLKTNEQLVTATFRALIQYANETVDALEGTGGEDALLCNNLGRLLQQRGHLAAAEPLLRRALAIDEGPEHPKVAIRCTNLGLLLRERGDLAAAEPLLRRALAIDEKALGLEHPDVAIDCNNLGSLLQDLGDLAAAEPLYRRALAIGEKALGPEHPGVAIRCNNLGLLLRERGDLAAAEPLFRRALAIDEKAFGLEHPDVAIDCNSLGLLLQDLGDLAAAEPLYRRSLAIGEKALGPEHPGVATGCINLGDLLKQRGDLTAAEPLIRRALAICEKAFGAEHTNVANACRHLADLLRRVGGHEAEAEQLSRKAEAIEASRR